MLDKSDTSVAATLLAFTNQGLDAGFLVPTQTAMEKSIIDAHDTFRSYLDRNKIHSFDAQAKEKNSYSPPYT